MRRNTYGGRSARRRLRATEIFLAAALLLGATACSARQVEITLHPETRLQKSTGWEVTTEIADVANADESRALPYYRDGLIALAVDRVGINRVRLEVRSGAENTDQNWRRIASGAISYEQWRPLRYATRNDNADPQVIDWAGFDFAELDRNVEDAVLPLQKALAARGERLFVNLCYVAFTDQLRGGAYHHDDPDEYAEFVLATYLHLQKRWGFVPDTWEVILEPDLVGRWDGRQIGERIVKAAARLEANGIRPRFVVPSVTNMAEAPRFIDEMAQVPGAMKYVEEFSYHRYRGASQGNLRKIAERSERYGKGAAMLEWWFGNATYKVLYEDLTVGRNTAWQGQVLMDLAERDLSDLRRPKLKLREDSRMNSQYFRYVRLGAQRIGASSNLEARAAPVAYVNANCGYAVIVKTAGPVRAMAIKGLPPGRYRMSYATESESVEPDKVYDLARGQTLTVDMPGAGVVSVFDVRLPPRTVSRR